MPRGSLALPLALAACCSTAGAHGLEAAGFAAGLAHPMGGWDHFLSMICVGIISARFGRAALFMVPGLFVLGMVAGFALGVHASSAPLGVEIAITLSVAVLGSVLLMPAWCAAAVTGLAVPLFGFGHGFAHGVEWPHQTSPVGFGMGFVLSTIALHAVGVSIGLLFNDHRLPGRSFAIAGTLMLVAASVLLASAPCAWSCSG